MFHYHFQLYAAGMPPPVSAVVLPDFARCLLFLPVNVKHLYVYKLNMVVVCLSCIVLYTASHFLNINQIGAESIA